MHGSLAPELDEKEDGLVITDGDYVDFISEAKSIIPNAVEALLVDRQLLFLGYSFGDWNVRSIYETAIRRPASGIQDYAVTLGLTKFEQTYFKKKDIVVILEGLTKFAAGIMQQRGLPS